MGNAVGLYSMTECTKDRPVGRSGGRIQSLLPLVEPIEPFLCIETRFVCKVIRRPSERIDAVDMGS